MKAFRSAAWIIIILGAILAHGSSVYNDFVFDDLIHINDNRLLRLNDYGWATISSAAFPGNLYRPLTFFSYYLQYVLSGLSPLPFHLFNLLLHSAVSLLVFNVARRFIEPTAAFAAAFIFSLHPLFVEVVANVSGRAEILAAFFILAGILRALQGSAESSVTIKTTIAIALCSFFAACSKESGLVMMPLLAISLWCVRAPASHLRSYSLAAITGSALYLGARFFVLAGSFYSPTNIDRHDNPLATLWWGRRVVEALTLLGFYIKKILFPLPLSADYSFKVFDFATPLSVLVIISAVLVSVTIAIALWGLLQRNRGGLFLSWFFLAFLLTSNILFPIGTVFAERLSYLPSIGVILYLASFLEQVRYPFLQKALAFGLAFPLLFISKEHTGVWRNSETLASYQEKISPESFRTQLLLAARDKRRGDLLGELEHIERSLQIVPENDQAYHMMGEVAVRQDRLNDAEAAFQHALTVNPDYLPSLNLYGRQLLNQGKLAEAAQMAEHIYRLEPDNSDGLIILFALAIKRGEYRKAIDLRKKLEERNVDTVDFRTLTNALEKVVNQ